MPNWLHGLPPELSAHIYEFAGNEKRAFRYMIRELDKTESWKTMNKFYQLAVDVSERAHSRHSYEAQHYTFRYALKIHLTKKELVGHFKNLGCRCCKRHRENCPTKIGGEWDEQPLYRKYDDPCPTDCKCRYYKRKLSEAHASPYVY